jgi:hypothetical protein
MNYAKLLTLAFCAFGFTSAAHAENTYSVGLEGFRDHYQEPQPALRVDEHADYGSVTGSFTHSANNGSVVSLEGRGSYGNDDYKSTSGVAKNIAQYEADVRVLGGYRVPVAEGSVIIPYIGLGGRYFFDNADGTLTNTGFYGYDRRIMQLYAPIGVSWQLTDGGWSFTPKAEFDPMLIGKVNSRLGSIPGYYDITNTQHRGYGWRGELMVGQKDSDYSWEFGPFVRAWTVADSEVAQDPAGRRFLEPHNTRVQAGAALRVSF